MPSSNPPEASIVGPHPSFIEIAKAYVFQPAIQDCLNAAGVSEAKDDSIRLQGVAWIDNTRKYIKLPVKTYNTACVYYHKFRLMHPDSSGYIDAAAAALFAACKIEDTLKKSKEILCAAHNMKVSPSEQLTPDDSASAPFSLKPNYLPNPQQLFENHSKIIIGLERLMLEASSFDFRNRHPQLLALCIVKHYEGDKYTVGKTTLDITQDLHRTYAPLKQTTAAMAFACVELAAHLYEQPIDATQVGNYDKRWCITREEVMETLLDLLDLYTHHRSSTIVGQEFALETFINIRIALNQEASAHKYPRYTMAKRRSMASLSLNGGTTTTNGKGPQTPTSPRDVPMKDITSPTSANGALKPGLKDGTVRFMLDPQRAKDEKEAVGKFFNVEEEEYETMVPKENRRP